MCEVCYDERSVVGSLALNSHTLTSCTIGIEHGFGIYAHVYLVVIRLHQPELLRLLSVDVFNEAV